MEYQIVRTDKADEQLREIIFYIADDSGSVEIALEYLDKIANYAQTECQFRYCGTAIPFLTVRSTAR